MHKTERQQKIIDLISNESIAKQADLAGRLSSLGYQVTQASVSRDIDELGIVKINGAYAMPQPRPNGLAPYSIETAGESLLVAKCTPGLASAVAVKIDAANIAEIIGTIAGDDTIFIAVADHRAQKTTTKAIWRLFEYE
jgi:transcriptional regulator of arginine metabolism